MQARQLAQGFVQVRFQCRLGQQTLDISRRLVLQCGKQGACLGGSQACRLQQAAADVAVADGEQRALDIGDFQRVQQQADHFEVAFHARMPIQLCPDQVRATGSQLSLWARAQHRVGIADAGGYIALQHVGIDAGCLRGDVGPHAHGATTQLIDQREGAEHQLLAWHDVQRVEEFDEWCLDEVVAPAPAQIQHVAAQQLELLRTRRQYLIDTVRQLPAVGLGAGRLLQGDLPSFRYLKNSLSGPSSSRSLLVENVSR